MTDEQLDNVMRLLDETEKVQKLGDRELTALILHCVWAKLNLGSPEEIALDEYISRFERMAGIKRDDEGNLIPE